MKNYLFFLMSFLVISFSQAQTEVGGATLPNTQSFKGETLTLNGAGIREKLWINLYVAGLYLPEKSSDAQEIVKANRPMAMKLHIVSGLVSNKKMMNALQEGFEKATNGNIKPIEDKINKLKSLLKEDIETGDVMDLVYLPSQGILAYKNGELKGSIPGMKFKKALFGIWLSNRPADDSLKEKLLGK